MIIKIIYREEEHRSESKTKYRYIFLSLPCVGLFAIKRMNDTQGTVPKYKKFWRGQKYTTFLTGIMILDC